jgi:hypothetical protein
MRAEPPTGRGPSSVEETRAAMSELGARKAGTRTAGAPRIGARKARSLRYAAISAALLLPTAAACGIQPTGITKIGVAPAAAGATQAQSPDTSPGSTQYLVYFYQSSRLTPAYRSAKGDVTETTVYNALVNGPNAQEQAAGYSSAVPPDLIVKARAADELGAYNLSEPLGQRAKAQFICTMQYYDQLDSIGIQIGNTRPIWNACQDTTSQFIPMRGDGTLVPSPSPSGD